MKGSCREIDEGGVRRGIARMTRRRRRCRLDPGLKAPPVSNFDCEKDNSAFNLNPGFLSLRHYTRRGTARQLARVRQ